MPVGSDSMSIEVSLESEGMQQVASVLNALSKLGAGVNAVELHSKRREDSEATNAEILKWLKKSGRDFTSLSASETEGLAKAAADEIERRLGREFSKSAVIDKWESKGKLKELPSFATEIKSAMLIEAMKAWEDKVSEHIDEQRTNEPPLNPLSEEYREKKLKDIGFAEPIGKYTGQLLDNLNPDGLGARNIRLRKS